MFSMYMSDAYQPQKKLDLGKKKWGFVVKDEAQPNGWLGRHW